MKSNAWIAALVAAGSLSCAAYANSVYYDETVVDNQSVNSPYRFDYVSRGPSEARPKQVFSDGYETFVEYSSSVRPTFFVVNGEKIKPKQSGQYYVIKGEYPFFTVRTPKGEVEIERRVNSTMAASVSSRSPKPLDTPLINEDLLQARFSGASASSSSGAAGQPRPDVDVPTKGGIAGGGDVPSASSAVAEPAKATALVLRSEFAGRLSESIRKNLEQAGVSLQWQSSVDFNIAEPFVITSNGVEEMLDRVAKLYSMPIEFCAGNSKPVVVVHTPGSTRDALACSSTTK